MSLQSNMRMKWLIRQDGMSVQTMRVYSSMPEQFSRNHSKGLMKVIRTMREYLMRFWFATRQIQSNSRTKRVQEFLRICCPTYPHLKQKKNNIMGNEDQMFLTLIILQKYEKVQPFKITQKPSYIPTCSLILRIMKSMH
ncbi:hypothetical protein FGO68_gene10785 [Halteria grandinella]|uniref:Uncharacterized protein n=1 Tax=Halteria grandinella TaxID=5974 RepID=A0A8J8NU89_HALGN|nr:hypothetical protein FGO68_gene10785 [Halteria grandinella]